MIDERTLSSLEEKRPEGLTSAEILDIFARNDVALSEATLRKYVQLGLLPRSIRVGKKGKHQGSQGVYPVQVVRLILTIKRMMAESFTIEQIQREFLFIRSDVEQLERALDGIFGKLDGVIQSRRGEHGTEGVRRDVTGARALSRDLVARLEAIETKLGERARMEKLAAS
jgi:DNA-binding transcriptional MerR regulator